MNIKQLFCQHKTTIILSRAFIKETREKSGQTVMGLPIWCNYHYFNELRQCISCDKLMTKENRLWVEPEKASVLY